MRKLSRSRRTCTNSRLPALPRLEQPAQGGECLRQLPVGQRRGLVERGDLVLDQCQVMQRVEEEVLALEERGWRAITSVPEAMTTSWT